MKKLIHLLAVVIKPPRKAQLLRDLESLNEECLDLHGRIQHYDYVWEEQITRLERELDDRDRRISAAMVALQATNEALRVQSYIHTARNDKGFLRDRIEEARTALRCVEDTLQARAESHDDDSTP